MKTFTKVGIVGAKEGDPLSDWLLDDERKKIEKAPRSKEYTVGDGGSLVEAGTTYEGGRVFLWKRMLKEAIPTLGYVLVSATL